MFMNNMKLNWVQYMVANWLIMQKGLQTRKDSFSLEYLRIPIAITR